MSEWRTMGEIALARAEDLGRVLVGSSVDVPYRYGDAYVRLLYPRSGSSLRVLTAAANDNRVPPVR